MQKTVKALRILIPILIVGFVALIYASYTSNRLVRTSVDNPVASQLRPGDEKPKLIAYAFEDTQTIGGRVAARIRAGRVMAFSSGWYTLENVHLTVYRPKGDFYEVSCPQAQLHKDTKQAEAKGGVRISSADGLVIETAEMKFDGNRMTNRIPLSFEIDEWKGNAGGLDLDVKEGRVRLFEKVTATSVGKAANEPPVTLTAQQATFHREAAEVVFEQEVVLTRAKDLLRADTISARFEQEQKRLLALHGSGNVHLRLSGADGRTKELGAGQKDIRAGRFFCDIGAEGQITAINASSDGQLVEANLFGPPRREIRADRFRVAVDGMTVTELRAEGRASVLELSTPNRRLSAARMVVFFDTATREPVSGIAEENFLFTDGKTEGKAERANYDIRGDRLILTALPGFGPSVVSEGHLLKADLLEVAPKEGTLKANGNVVAKLVSKGGSTGSSSDTSLFPDSREPVFVNSNLLVIRRATNTAVFMGNVRAWQGNNTIFSAELQVTGSGDTIEAKGGVRAVLYNNKAGARKAPVLARSDRLLAIKKDRRVNLDGNVQIDEEARRLNSDQASFFFDANKSLDRIEASSKLTIVEKATGRQGSGDKVVYRLAQKMLYLDGSPATVSEPRGTIKGNQIVFDLARNKVDVVSGGSPTEATYTPQ